MKTPMYYVNLISGLLVIVAGPCIILVNRFVYAVDFLSEIDESIILVASVLAAACAYVVIINAVIRFANGKPSNLDSVDFDTLIKIEQELPKPNLFLVELHTKGKVEVETMADSRLNNKIVGHFYQKKYVGLKSWYLSPVTTTTFEPNSMTL